MFRVSSHPSSGVHKTATTASGTGQSIKVLTRGYIYKPNRLLVATNLVYIHLLVKPLYFDLYRRL